jgi:hypothetical protein
VPDELLKFGTTVKRKEHEAYGAFAKDVDMTKTAKKIKFDYYSVFWAMVLLPLVLPSQALLATEISVAI